MKKYYELDNDTNMSFKLPKELRNDFSDICKKNAFNQSSLIRKWIIEFVKKEQEAK